MTQLSPMHVIRATQVRLAKLHRMVSSDDAHVVIYEVERALSDATLALLSASRDLPGEAARYASSYTNNQRTVKETVHATRKAFQAIAEVLRFLAIVLEEEEPRAGADELVSQGLDVGGAGDGNLGKRLLDACKEMEDVLADLVVKVGVPNV